MVSNQNSQNRNSVIFAYITVLMDTQKPRGKSMLQEINMDQRQNRQYFIIAISIKSILLSFVTFHTILSRDIHELLSGNVLKTSYYESFKNYLRPNIFIKTRSKRRILQSLFNVCVHKKSRRRLIFSLNIKFIY